MHVNTHLKPESEGKTGKGIYPDGMVEHDGHVGQLLKKLDDLGVANNTIVVYTTDNGAEVMTWPDGGNTPFRGEKATNWEGGYRVPMLIRWPGVIKPEHDLQRGLLALRPDPDLLRGRRRAGRRRQVPEGLSGRRQDLQGPSRRLQPDAVPHGEAEGVAARDFLYWNDDGELVSVRVDDWKVVFKAQEHEGIDVWRQEFTNLRAPKLLNLRADPFERGDTSMEYEKWFFARSFVVVPSQAIVAKWLESFKEFPIRQKPASFNLDEVMEKLTPKN